MDNYALSTLVPKEAGTRESTVVQNLPLNWSHLYIHLYIYIHTHIHTYIHTYIHTAYNQGLARLGGVHFSQLTITYNCVPRQFRFSRYVYFSSWKAKSCAFELSETKKGFRQTINTQGKPPQQTACQEQAQRVVQWNLSITGHLLYNSQGSRSQSGLYSLHFKLC